MATRRNIVLCAEDTDAAAHACEWVLQSVHRDEDVLHLVSVQGTKMFRIPKNLQSLICVLQPLKQAHCSHSTSPRRRYMSSRA